MFVVLGSVAGGRGRGLGHPPAVARLGFWESLADPAHQLGGRRGAAVGDARSPQLTSRQAAILVKVVETYVATGQPVASRTLAADPELASAPSTIRNELALLEEHGLLAHPHTSAGRMPTDAGHRYVVDRLLAAPASTALDVPMSLSPERRELDEFAALVAKTPGWVEEKEIERKLLVLALSRAYLVTGA